ncbi:receptor-type tyrosine-protein phosphatase eta isoform X3 [Triplophysa dalaica]|uniref:receptor-type tyrosine-protein phosphatase eta isoform X3 n=1 Tax=Triplophysa dalaica TaxID=1582913 RepID=UPI0024DFD58F|nr:receptor-type tyrosine-protein phosphatase eta isoform X3 [Triplophysa dalaica]
MGQHYLSLESIVFALLVLIPYGHSECVLCLNKSNSTADVTIHVGNMSSCGTQGSIFTSNQSSLTVTGLQPGYTYFLKITCSDECCSNRTIGDTSNNLTVTQFNSTSVNLTWTGQLPLVNQTFTLRPEQVTNLSVTSITVNSVFLSWMPQNGISPYYRVAWGVNPQFSLTTNQTSMHVSQLAPGTKYNFKVTSVASDNRTEGQAYEKSQNTYPAQVENITEVSFSNSSLTIKWMAPPGQVERYIVNISSAELSMSKELPGIENLTEIGNLTAGRVYNITVTSVSGILKNISSVVSFATRPNPPEALIVRSRTNASISLQWSRPLSMDGVDVSYEVSFTSGQSNGNQTINQVASILSNLSSGSRYEICVATVGVKNRRSSCVNLTSYSAPNPVKNLGFSVSTRWVNLTWLPPSGNSSLFSYIIDITTLNNTFKTTSSNYQITELEPGTQYNCSVRTHILNGNISGPSLTITCNTKPLPVVNLIATRIGSTEMLLSWSHQSDYKSTYVYNVSVNGELRAQNRSETANITNLIPGSNYTFTVQTVANGISSELVSVSEFTGLDKASIVSAVGTTLSIKVDWRPPAGIVSHYSVRLQPFPNVSKTVLKNETSVVFSGLMPGTLYNVVVSSISGPIKQDSDVIQNATLPTPPRDLLSAGSTDSLNISWARPLNMSSGSYIFLLECSSTNLSRSINGSQDFILLTDLRAGVQYNITVKTVGALGYRSTPLYISTYTNPSPVTGVKVTRFTESSITLVWEQHDDQQYGYSYLLNITNEQKIVNNTSIELLSLQSASQYNISIITQTAGHTQSKPHFITVYSKPYPVSNVSSEVLNVSAVRLNWYPPIGYHSGISYRILVSNCLPNSKNLSTSSENITVTDLVPGTQCLFSLYSLAYGILGEPQNITTFTKPSAVVPKVENRGSNNSLVVMWDPPIGGLDMYILNISSMEWNASINLNNTQHNHTFSQLKAATLYNVTLTTVLRTLQETSSAVNNATYPNKPGELKELSKSNHSLLLWWVEAQGMTPGSFNYSLTYWLGLNSSQFWTTNNTFLLDNLRSGTSYNVSVATEGPMGFKSESVFRFPVTTKPDPVRSLQINSTKTNAISVTWVEVERVTKYVVRVYEKAELRNYTTGSGRFTVENLMPSTRYTISVRSSTSDDTEGDDERQEACTDAAPVETLTCIGPNLTLPMLMLSWGSPPGGYLSFELELSSDSSVSTTASNTGFNHSFTGLKYKTSYNASLWTIGCGKNSTVKTIQCMTGITRPVVPTIEKAAKVSETQYNKFTVILQPEVFNDANGPVLYYGVLVHADATGCQIESNQLLFNTYEHWKANRCSTYLAVVKATVHRNVDEHTLVIGDQTQWNGYTNGELNAKGSYRFAIITFTHLEISNNLVNVSNSYYSISQFCPTSILLPENPVVIGGVAGGVAVIAVLIVILIGVVVCRRKQSKDDSTSVPIHSIRTNPIKVEDYEAYYKRQRADSFCGFAEEFEDLRPVGMSQAKTVATAPENKAKNRYNNVLPYDSSRVKLSMPSSPFDEYINASYMPGYTSKKEFIAAQGPLPCTVNDFWRMIWEKNVHTIVMLTKCNEQGRVKCEEYWPSDMKSFNNLTVTTTSTIPLEDWTISDFEVKNVKTAETRSVRHFHFTAWPDHGVPETTELLINFRHLVREHMEQYSRHSPTLVHCSAGVGRTGTLIAIDRLIFQIERDGVVDVYGIIHDLRMHRPLMVQTEDQYVFLNQCAMDFIKSRTGNNVDLIYQNTAALTIYENFEPLKKSKNGFHNA